jgi:calcium permeable stress-gated cation channel
MVAVGLVFAPLAPLVALAAGICFWINSFVYKYQLMFVYVSKVESGGVSTMADLRVRHV